MKQKIQHTFSHYLLTCFLALIHMLTGDIIWITAAIVGYLVWQTKRTPYDLIVGLPLMFVAIGFLFNGFWTVVLSIFSPSYNRGMCRFCN